jgi:hypothetical protein
VLDLFGRNNIFSEYTVHDFSHVEAMLSDLDWLIPASTQELMTPADWLMITLGIYFHDLGLVVTENEFQRRHDTDFLEFCDTILFAKSDGQDYKIKVESLGQESAERFFYQEFVRANHAKRVRAWIEGSQSEALGFAPQRQEIDGLFSRLGSDFRKDLAMVCESHNLDDLDNLSKYKTFRPYGRTQSEGANLIYVAAILRTADLMQITRQRAPSVMFRMINPTDPISQAEWAKQNGVTGIFPKETLDKEGRVSQPDTIAVYAKFDNENGFFGLTSYLAYAEKQLSYSYSCVQKANATISKKLEFPWRRIDDSNVEAVGFIPTPFEFQIDQTKILDLLTGHTLYNDSSVAIRELVQNAIDAVRLQHGGSSLRAGRIDIGWDSATRTLIIRDNGTGMTQEIIERHLLNVGSSRYQDQKFKEQHPEFSPISRFGIGVLSTFMVADTVQIVTFHEEEEFGRLISLRSVHGKYLIRLVDKASSEEGKLIGGRGTQVTLKMRASAKRVDVLDTLLRWIMFPRCEIEARIDGEPAVRVGYESPAEAIQSYLESEELAINRARIEVHEKEIGSATLAFATGYNPHYRERYFVQFSESMQERAKTPPPIGVCVEGIRVEFGSPGFVRPSSRLLSIVNYSGADAPKTNVARSSLESESDRVRIAAVAYDAYLGQVQDEIGRLQQMEGFSLSYAVNQFPFIAAPLFGATSNEAMRKRALAAFPMFMVEGDQGRRAASADELVSAGGFWTVESNAMRSLIDLLIDTPPNVTCKQVVEFSQFKGAPMPSGNLMTSAQVSAVALGILESEFEVSELSASITARRLDARWTPKDVHNPIWINTADAENTMPNELGEEYRRYRRYRQDKSRQIGRRDFLIASNDFPVTGLENYCAVLCLGTVLLLPSTELAKFLKSQNWTSNPEYLIPFLVYVDSLAPLFVRRAGQGKTLRGEIEYAFRETLARFEDGLEIDTVGFLDAVSKTEARLSMFDPWSWMRDEAEAEY